MDPERFKANHQPNHRPVDTLSNLPPAPLPIYVKKRKPAKAKWWLWLVPVIALLGSAGWFLLFHKAAAVRHSSAVAHATYVAPKATLQAPAAPPIPSTSYNSTTFALSFNYPTSWAIVDSGSAGITVTSPSLNLINANGQTVNGQIVMSLTKQGTIPSGFGTNSVAVLSSTKINYTQPTSTQAAGTYISFVQYPATNTKGGLDGIFLTGNYGYKKDQTIPSSDLAKINPLIDFTFLSCASASCPASSRQPLTIASTNWSNNSFSAPILLIFKSFSFD